MQVKLRPYNAQQWAQVCLRGFVIERKGNIGAHKRMSLGRESASGSLTRETGSDIYVCMYYVYICTSEVKDTMSLLPHIT
jgi:hypothetical protein